MFLETNTNPLGCEKSKPGQSPLWPGVMPFYVVNLSKFEHSTVIYHHLSIQKPSN